MQFFLFCFFALLLASCGVLAGSGVRALPFFLACSLLFSRAPAMASMLVHLRPENALVQEQVLSLLTAPADARPATADTRLGDFDNAYWRIEVMESAPTQVFVCLEVPCFAQLKACVGRPRRGCCCVVPAAARLLPSLHTPHTTAPPPRFPSRAGWAWRRTCRASMAA